MRDKYLEPALPWRLIFLLNSLCYFAFAGLLKLINNNLPIIFFWIGIVSFGIGCIACIGTLVMTGVKKRQLLSAD